MQSSGYSLCIVSNLKIPAHFLYILLFSIFKVDFFIIMDIMSSLKMLELAFTLKSGWIKGLIFIKIDRSSKFCMLETSLRVSLTNYNKYNCKIYVAFYSDLKFAYFYFLAVKYSVILLKLLSIKPGNLFVYSLISHLIIFLISLYFPKLIVLD